MAYEYEADSSYTPPAALSEIDDEVIHARILDTLPPDIDKTPGGFAYEFTKPASIIAANLMIDLNEAIQVVFPQWSYGAWLDIIAQSARLTRRGARAATGNLTITGVAGTVIPAGFLFATASIGGQANVEFASTEEATLDVNGEATVHVECTEAGVVGNVPANAITLMSTPMTGLETITNEEAFSNGADEEDDDVLRERIAQVDQQGDTLGVGSIADYIKWALEVPGVGSAIVMPEWQGAGTGTVKLLLAGSDGLPASEDVCDEVYDHIMSPDEPTLRKAPIGAILTVAGTSTVSVSVEASVYLKDGYDIDDVEDEFEELLGAYFAEIAESEDTVVRYTKVCSVLSSVSGVLDYTNLLINDDTDNIVLSSGETPIIQSIVLDVVTE